LIFSETNCETFKYKRFLIYFLLKGNEVVYVGQTKRGILRPFSHNDKVFDTIKILHCNEEDLCVLEDRYIDKYKPKYNKTINLASNYPLKKARNLIRGFTGNADFSVTDLKLIIKKLDVKTVVVDCNVYIKQSDFEKIFNYIKGDVY